MKQSIKDSVVTYAKPVIYQCGHSSTLEFTSKEARARDEDSDYTRIKCLQCTTKGSSGDMMLDAIAQLTTLLRVANDGMTFLVSEHINAQAERERIVARNKKWVKEAIEFGLEFINKERLVSWINTNSFQNWFDSIYWQEELAKERKSGNVHNGRETKTKDRGVTKGATRNNIKSSKGSSIDPTGQVPTDPNRPKGNKRTKH